MIFYLYFRYQCLGLLGLAGAGKTSTINMILGYEILQGGDIYSRGYNIRNQEKLYSKNIGFLLNEKAIKGYMTARVMLRITCLVKGIQKNITSYVIQELAESFGLTRYLDMKTSHYSPGTIRKLNLAMAVIGSTILCLDEPTVGIDICARKEIWVILSRMRNSGKSLLITSTSSRECEELCNTVAIMVNGKLVCLGSAYYLKSHFKNGITINFQMANKSEMERFRRYTYLLISSYFLITTSIFHFFL